MKSYLLGEGNGKQWRYTMIFTPLKQWDTTLWSIIKRVMNVLFVNLCHFMNYLCIAEQRHRCLLTWHMIFYYSFIILYSCVFLLSNISINIDSVMNKNRHARGKTSNFLAIEFSFLFLHTWQYAFILVISYECNILYL